MWRGLRRELKKIVAGVYTELVGGQGMTPPAPHTRAILPAALRCVQHSVYRDIRNFVVFRSIRDAAHFYHQIFKQK